MKPKQFLSRLFVAGSFALSALGASGCGQNAVKDVSVQTYHQDGKAYVGVTTVLDVGEFQIPSIELPIFDPRDFSVTYGTIAMAPLFPKFVEVRVNLDLTSAAQVPGGTPSLPNGSSLPLGGLDGIKVIQLPVAEGAAQFYIGIGRDFSMVGFAIPVQEWDEVGRRSGQTKFFASFATPNGIRGTAGVFTGPQPSQTGFGFFADVSRFTAPPAVPAGPGALVSARAFALAFGSRPNVTFRDEQPSSSKANQISRSLRELSSRKTRISVAR